MATTTNFGWTTPDDTSLVKDGAAAIRSLGQSIDTSMADLEGGTTGQILSKTTNADMDFTWVTPNPGDITGVTAGTGISGGGTSGDVTVTNSMATAIDAKGDLIVGTGADAFSRLAVGTNAHVLTADSTTATGLKWAAAAGGAWTNYTPTYTNLTVGNGTVLSRYLEVDGTIFLEWFFDFGTTSSFGSGPTITLPVAARTGKGSFFSKILDSGNSYRPAEANLNSGTVMGLQFINYSAGTSLYNSDVSSTAPQVWAVNDGFYIRGFYEKA